MKKKIFATVLCVLVLLSFALSLAFVAVSAGHFCACNHDHCSICTTVAVCTVIIRVCSGTIAIAAAIALFRHTDAVLFSRPVAVFGGTPVSRKVELLN